MLVTLTHLPPIGDVVTTVLTGTARLNGQIQTIKPFYIIQTTQPVSISAAGTLALTQILLSAALALTVADPDRRILDSSIITPPRLILLVLVKLVKRLNF